MIRHYCLFLSTLASAIVGSIRAQSPYASVPWEVVNPSTTGIPGEEVRAAALAPDGTVWLGARYPFWTHGGIGILDPDDATWTVHSNVANSATIRFPSAFPNDIEFAADGSVWVATDNGLAHFVGGKWKTFTAANSPLPYDVIEAIDLDSRGGIWINSQRGPAWSQAEVVHYDGRTRWRSWSVGAGIPWTAWTEITGMWVDANDHVWIGNAGETGFAEFDGLAWTVHQGAGVPFIGLGHPYADRFGAVWAHGNFSGGGNFYRFDSSGWTNFSPQNTPIISTAVTTFAEDASGRLYVGTWRGQIVRQINPGGSQFEVFTQLGALSRVSTIMPKPNGDVWVSSVGGTGSVGTLYQLDANGLVTEEYNTFNTGMPDYGLDYLHRDRVGNLWTASGLGGLSSYRGGKWRNWGEFNVGSEPYPWSGNTIMGGYYLDSRGRGWMGGNGIGQWDPESGTFANFRNWQNNPGLGTSLMTHFAEDLNGVVFASNQAGQVYRFNGTHWVQELVAGTVLTYAGIRGDQHGNVYAPGVGLVHIWNGASWTQIQLPAGHSRITALALGPDDAMWVGTDNGLIHIHSGTTRVFDANNSPLPTSEVRGVDVRNDGLVGVSSHDFNGTSGVSIIDGDPANSGNWFNYSASSSPIPVNQLEGVSFDDLGDLWVIADGWGAAVARIGRARRMTSPTQYLPYTSGGRVDLDIDFGLQQAGQSYIVLGSATGTYPGTLVGQSVIPVVNDWFTSAIVSNPGPPFMSGFVGTLDASGQALATFDTGQSLPLALVGLQVWFAAATINDSTNPVAVMVIE